MDAETERVIRALQTLHPRPCEHCGRVYTPRMWWQLYCTPRCLHAARAAKNPVIRLNSVTHEAVDQAQAKIQAQEDARLQLQAEAINGRTHERGYGQISGATTQSPGESSQNSGQMGQNPGNARENAGVMRLSETARPENSAAIALHNQKKGGILDKMDHQERFGVPTAQRDWRKSPPKGARLRDKPRVG